jgi:IS5 family transposase
VPGINQRSFASAGMGAKVAHSFHVIKQQFSFTHVRYRRLAKNTAQIVTMSKPWMGP